jgi:hypothetical protein
MLKLGFRLRYIKCSITKCVYFRPGVKIRLGLKLKVFWVSLPPSCRRAPFVNFLVWQLLMSAFFRGFSCCILSYMVINSDTQICHSKYWYTTFLWSSTILTWAWKYPLSLRWCLYVVVVLACACVGYCLFVFPWPVLVFSSVVACMRGCVGLVPEDGPIRPKHVVKGNVWCICATNCVEGNSNKALSYTQYDAEVQHF